MEITLEVENYKKVFTAWKSAVDVEGYDYPFMEMWAIDIWDARLVWTKNRDQPAILKFKDDESAMIFKLTYL
jgi:hypothetical protein